MENPFYGEDVNYRPYSSTNIGTLSSISDADTFFDMYNRKTAYMRGETALSLGNYITIQDGIYNTIWEIAGFDTDNVRTAADGTIYSNGVGMCMIPKTYVTMDRYHTELFFSGGYMSSYMHTTVLPNIINQLKNVLGDHIVNRNVLLSSSMDTSTNYYSNAYTWTTAYATLMSVGQMTGTFAKNNNKYDDGESNYKLPLFNYEHYWTGFKFWTRGILGNVPGIGIHYINDNGTINSASCTYYSDIYVRPMIYLR